MKTKFALTAIVAALAGGDERSGLGFRLHFGAGRRRSLRERALGKYGDRRDDDAECEFGFHRYLLNRFKLGGKGQHESLGVHDAGET